MSRDGAGDDACVLLTRSTEDNRAMALRLRQRGIESVSLPMIEIRPIAPDLSTLPPPGTRTTVLITSRTAAHGWLSLRREDARVGNVSLQNYLVVGRRSASILLADDPQVNILVMANSVEELLEDMIALDRQTGRLRTWLKPTPLLYPCSRLRREEAVAGLTALRYRVIELPIYEPHLPARSRDELPMILDALAPNAILTFFSPSGVDNFFTALAHNHLGLDRIAPFRIAAIGSTTAEALYAKGIEEGSIPERPEMGVMVEMIVGSC